MSERNVFRNNGLSKFYLMAGLLIGVCCLPDLLLAQVESTPTFTEVSRQTVELLGQRDRNHRYYNVIREIEVADPNSGESRAEERISKVVEVGGGICYQDATGQWRLTDTAWRPTPEGFVMDQANYTLAMGRTADSPLIYTFEGRDMRLHADRIEVDNGLETVLLAQIQSGISGVIRPETPHKLLFANAFGSGIDLEYEALPGGYHQNVIFHVRPELPAGFAVEQSQIKLLTEIDLENYLGVRGDATVKIRVYHRDAQTHKRLATDYTAATLTTLSEMLATKEDISFVAERPGAEPLVSHCFAPSWILQDASEGKSPRLEQAAKQIYRDTASGKFYLVEQLDAPVMENAAYPLVWDYQNISGFISQDTTWYADTTYYVSNLLFISNATLSIEPGTVVKLDGGYISALFGGSIVAKGNPYNYIYFTDKNDDETGEIISGSSGSPQKSYLINGNDDSIFQYCKIRYAARGIHFTLNADDSPQICHNIFDNCVNAVFVNGSANATGTYDIHNNLFTHCDEGIYVSVDSEENITVNITNNTFAYLFDYGICIVGTYADNVAIINNLLTNSTVGISKTGSMASPQEHHNAFYNCTTSVSGFSLDENTDITDTNDSLGVPYDIPTTGLGYYYLNQNASGGELLKNAGADTVGVYYEDPCAWSIYQVADSGYYFNTDTTVSPDTGMNQKEWGPNYNTCDTGTVAIGYHHPRIDYFLKGCTLTFDGGAAPATLKVKPGTVVAHFQYDSGDSLVISTGDQLEIAGNPYTDDGKGYITWVHRNAAGTGCAIKYYDNQWDAIHINSGGSYDVVGGKFMGLGRAITVSSASGAVRDSVFTLNYDGIFSICCYAGTSNKIDNSLFYENMSGAYGYSAWTNSSIQNSTFDRCCECVAHISSYTVLEIRNCLFRESAYGIEGYRDASDFDESHNLFYNVTNPFSFTLDVTDYAYPFIMYVQQVSGDPLISDWSDISQRFYLDQSREAVNHGYDPQTGGMPGYTTNYATQAADSGTIDIGYHYPLATDTDGDGLLDGEEYWAGTGISNVDSDGDGLVDGLNGKILLTVYTDGIDANEDGYVDGEHDEDMESNPALPDTDDDDYDDGVERLHGSDPDDDQSEPSSGTIDVPTQVYLIQNAIDYAIAGDEIILAPGEYTGEGNRDIDFSGKAVTVRGTDPLDPDVVAATMINCQGTSQDPHRGFLLINGEGTDSKIAGLTITNGYGPNITYGGYVYSAGGALVLYDSNPTFENICLHDNLASWGGAIYAVDAQYTLTNGLLYDNNADYGGAIYQENYTVYVLESNIINCTFSNNVANEEAGALYAYYFDQVSISNSIIWGNTATNTIYENVMSDASNLDFSYCDYQGSAYSRNGGTVGFTNSFASDPCFINAAGDDYHLKSTVGRWNPATSSWTTDAITSPCIDRGDPSDTYSNEPAPNGGVINLGYYGNTEQASKSSMGLLTVTITPTEAINAGAQWRLVYKSGDNYYYYDAYWRDSGDYIFNIMPGTYYLCVTDIEGYIPYNDLYGTSSIVTGYYPFILSSPITIGAGLNQEVIEYYEASVLYVSTVGDNNNTGHIYDPYLTIQHAISECTGSTGMRVYVYFGNYTENINVNKDIRIDGNGSVITGASGDSSVITVGNSATIDGFYVTGGNYDYGGGMRVIGAATVRDCIFYNNNAGIDGGALYCQGTFLEDTRFYNCYFGTVSSTNKVNNNPGDHSAEIYISSTPGPSYAYFSGCYLRGYALDLYGSYCDWPSKQW